MKTVIMVTGTAFIILLLLHFIFPLRDAPTYSMVVTDEKGEMLHAFLSVDEKWRMQVTPAELPASLRTIIIYKEDRYFYYHPGINPFAIARAFVKNTFKGKKTSGASTITMQVARLLYPRKRTYLNKMCEMFRALQIELKYSKEEILSLYLSLAPYGGNIEGVKAASFFYFGIHPSRLNLSQSVLLSIIPNRPGTLNPAKGKSALTRERDRWLNELENDEIFPGNEISRAKSEIVEMERKSSPKEIPHLAHRLRKIQGNEPEINTTINKNIQEKVEAIAFNHYKRLSLKNIHNLSVLVIENKTHRVKAYAGSPDFYDQQHAGQVDGLRAVRSPGSTLKPLVYAMAADKGLLTPATMLEDVPSNYGGYAPENFNSKCNGMVSAGNALAYSLNIPAVTLLNNVGLKDFTGKLRSTGFSAIKKDSDMGLSIILGGCGVRATELGAMFSSLSNDGMYSPLKYSMNDTATKETRMVSNAAAYMITEMLTSIVRPDLPNNYESSMHVPKIAWKTGTSYGRRDAWSIGYNKKYTIVTWVGNFSGEGVPELTGADMATPLLFDLFNAIDYGSSDHWYAAPTTMDFRMVCPQSGLPAGDFCTDFITDSYIPGVSPYKKCTHLREVMIAHDGNCSYCTRCAPETGYRVAYYDNLSPAVHTFYSNNGIAYMKTPPHNPGCTRLFSDHHPEITSPVNRMEYLLEKDAEQQLRLSCNADPDISTLYWYVNDRFVEKTKPGTDVFITPSPGNYKISCSDDKGRNSDINIEVKFF